MIWADWFILGVIALSCVLSLLRGFVREAISLSVWVLAFIIAQLFSSQVSLMLHEHIASSSLRYLVAFGGLFLLTMVLGSMLSKLLGELVKSAGLGSLDRLLGTVFGFMRGVIIILAILIFLPKLLPVEEDSWWQESRFIPQVLRLENWSRGAAAATMEFLGGVRAAGEGEAVGE